MSPHFSARRGQHMKSPPPTFSVQKTVYGHETDDSTLLVVKLLNSDINFRLHSGKLLDKLLGWPQLDRSPVNIHHGGLCHFAPLC